MNTKYIIANWKMNGSKALVRELAASANASAKGLPTHVKQVLCPPAPYLTTLSGLLEGNVGLGGQNCHQQQSGAFTGEISADMLKELGAGYVILGHSERREYAGETNALVKAKVEAALEAGLNPIICIGEPLEIRKKGEAEAYTTRQLIESLPESAADTPNPQILLAYEPIWAIGSGLVPEPQDIERMHAALHDAMSKRSGQMHPVIYGGSVNEENARDILATGHVSGVLVGGASLKAKAFAAIAASA